MVDPVENCERKIKTLEQRIEATKKKIEEIKNLTALQIAKKRYVGTVRVDEDGYFSTCPDLCDDCFTYEYILPSAPDFPQAYEEICEKRHICSRKSEKVYTYYLFDYKALAYIASKIDVEAEKAKMIEIEMESIKKDMETIEKLKKELEEAKKAQQEYENLKIKVQEIIREKNLHEIKDIYTPPNESKEVIGDVRYDHKRLTVTYYPEIPLLEVYECFFEGLYDPYPTWTYYSTKEGEEKLARKFAEKIAAQPMDYLHYVKKVILDNGKLDKATEILANDNVLKQRMIENFTKHMTRTELTEKELKYPGSSLTRLDEESIEKKICDALGITEKVREAMNIRIQKIEEYRRKREEEEKKLREEKKRAAEEKISKIHHKLMLIGISGDVAEIKIGKCDKETFNEAVANLKKTGAKFDWQEKVWRLKVF